jgi:hypothetical protein
MLDQSSLYFFFTYLSCGLYISSVLLTGLRTKLFLAWNFLSSDIQDMSTGTYRCLCMYSLWQWCPQVGAQCRDRVRRPLCAKLQSKRRGIKIRYSFRNELDRALQTSLSPETQHLTFPSTSGVVCYHVYIRWLASRTSSSSSRCAVVIKRRKLRVIAEGQDSRRRVQDTRSSIKPVC